MTMRQLQTLDLVGLPFDLGAAGRGSAFGPAALRAAGLPGRLRDRGWGVEDHGDLASPPISDIGDCLAGHAHHRGAVAAWTQAIHDRAYTTARAGTLPVFMGGDHSVSMGTVSGVARACRERGQEIAVLWLDAHADFNTPATSATGNVHGMAVAFLAGLPGLEWVLPDRPFLPILPQRVALLGLRDVDTAEQAALDRSGISAMPMSALRARGIPVVVDEFLARIDSRTTHLHVSLDLDVIDPALAPGVGTGVAGGATLDEARLLATMLARSGLLGSLDLVELDPTLDPSGRSAEILTDLAVALLS